MKGTFVRPGILMYQVSSRLYNDLSQSMSRTDWHSSIEALYACSLIPSLFMEIYGCILSRSVDQCKVKIRISGNQNAFIFCQWCTTHLNTLSRDLDPNMVRHYESVEHGKGGRN